jgi:hypothetical protein
VLIDSLVMSETAKSKWISLSPLQKQAVDQSFQAIVRQPSRVVTYNAIEVTRRFEDGRLYTYEVSFIESDECFFAIGVYADKVPVVLDIVIKGEVCLWAH